MMILRGALFVVVLAATLAGQSAQAQVVPCEDEIRRAEIAYRDGGFEEAESILAGCLEHRMVADREAVIGYRIVALSRLQLGDIAGARIAVLRIFARRPGYTADAVLDPPGYQALVETVRQQLDDSGFRREIDSLRVQRQRAIVEVDPIPAYRRGGTAYLMGVLGANSYGGERGETEGSSLSEFTANGGLLIGLAGGYNVIPHLAVQLQYEIGRYATINNQKAAIFPTIDPATSSPWVQSLSVQALARAMPGWPVTPYLRGGPGIAIARLNSEWRVGTAAEVAFGADVSVTRELGVFADAGARWVFPGDAMDLIAREADHDLFTFARIGLVWRVGSMF